MVDFVGGGGNDTFVGTELNDNASGGGGADTLIGNGGNDTLEGNSGGDYLDGGTGDDTLYSGNPSPAFTYPFYYSPWTAPVLDTGAEQDTLLGGAGNDRLFAGFGDNVDGGVGYDTLYVSFMGAAAGVTADFRLATLAIGGGTITGIEGVDWVQGSDFDDDITLGSGGSYTTPVFGMGGNDRLVAGYYTGSLYGGDGDDVLDGRGSGYIRILDGGAGNDTIYASANTTPTVNGGDGDDTIYAGYSMFGDAGNDTIYILNSYYSATAHGGTGDDRIYASANGSFGTIYGDEGADMLTGDAGTDIFDGGAGNDTITGGAQSIYGQYIGDIAIYSGSLADYQLTLNAGTGIATMVDLRAASPDGTDSLSGVELLRFTNGTYQLSAVAAGQASGVANFVGTAIADSWYGSEDANTAIGNGGADTLFGFGGIDVLQGNAGGDTLNGGTGDDTLYSGDQTGAYTVPFYATGWTAPTLDTGTEVDTLLGGAGYDVLFAGYSDNVDGGSEYDTLFISFRGASTGVTADFRLASNVIGGGTITGIEYIGWVEGSEFDDDIAMPTAYNYSGSGAAPMFGLGGNDRLVAGASTGSLFGGDGNDVLDGRGSSDLRLADGGAGDDTIYTKSNIAGTVTGGDGNDTIIASGTIDGGAGNDTITLLENFYYGGSTHGGSGDDTITAAPIGSSNVFGDAGNDTLNGGDGYDTLEGGAGNDTISGGAQSYYYSGGYTGDIAVYSGNASDYLLTRDAGTGAVTIVDKRAGSPDGTDVLSGIEILKFANGVYALQVVLAGQATGVQNFVGTSNADTYYGSEDANTAIGNGGADSLYGYGGNDVLQGNAGGDILDGGTGDDTLYSGNLTGSWNAPYYNNLWTAPTLDTGSEVDTLIGGDGSDTIFAGYGDNVDGGANGYNGDTLYISFAGASAGVTADFRLATQTIGGGTITGIEGVGWVEGSGFDDDITMNSNYVNGGSAPVFGLGGNDRLVAGSYTSSLWGGDGNDVLDGRANYYLQRLEGGAGDDTLYTAAYASATSNGGDGNDTIHASGTINGDAGNDTIYLELSNYSGLTHGGSGDDTIYAASNGSSNVFGDDGNDTLNGGDGFDTLEGGAGNDTIVGGAQTVFNYNAYNPYAGDVAVYSGNVADYLVTQDSGTGVVTVVDLRPGSPNGSDTLTGIEILKFANGAYALAVVLAGNATGIQNFVGTPNADTFYGSEDANTAIGNGGADTLFGYGGNDVLQGNAGGDTLDGGAGDDTLYSGDASGYWQLPYYGNPLTSPTLDTGTEVDTLSGGAGNDTLFAGYGDNVDGGDGSDTLLLSLRGAATGVTVDFNATNLVIGGGTIIGIETLSWIEASNFDDDLTLGNFSNYYTNTAVFGLGGNDRLVAGAYTGALYGGDGNDVLDGRLSQSLRILDGGAGDDTLYSSASYSGSVSGGDGNDTISASGVIDGGAGNDTITLLDSFNARVAHGGTGDDTINAAPGGSGYVYGDEGADTLNGGDGRDTLEGGAGNDFINGGAQSVINYNYYGNYDGDVSVYSGNVADYLVTQNSGTGVVTVVDQRAGSPDGTDTLNGIEILKFANGTYALAAVLSGQASGVQNFVGTPNADSFYGSEDANTAIGNAGSDTFYGFGGSDVLQGNGGGDYLDGGSGNDTLYSGDQTDSWNFPNHNYSWTAPTLDTGSELDTLIGGAGGDVLFAGYGDNVDGGTGIDKLYISFRGAASGVTVDFTLASNAVGGGTITGIEDVAWVEGSNFDDDITLNSTSGNGFNTAFGLGGNDRLIAGYYTGTLWGGDGNDFVDGRLSVYLQSVDGGAGDDTLYTSTNSNATAYGGDGNDTIFGYGTIYGDGGNDTIYIQSTYYYAQTFGGTGDDTIYAAVGGSYSVFGEDGNDALVGNLGNDTLTGGNGSDTLTGGGGINTMLGGTGNDRMEVGAADAGSNIDGGADSDTLVVMGSVSLGTLTNIEAIEFQNGATLTLSAAQLINGLALGGTIGGNGSLIVNMSTSDVELAFNVYTFAPGSTLALTINGSSEGEIIKGFTGITQTINGGDGDDQIRGGNQSDTINGGNGDDKIAGAGGADILTGGAGADSFRFQSTNTTGLGAAADRITDFVIGTDRLAFQAIDADAVTPGDQGFSFLGTGAFSNTGVGQIRYQNSGANLLVQIDSDGNGVADMEVVLQGLAGQALTGASFLL